MRLKHRGRIIQKDNLKSAAFSWYPDFISLNSYSVISSFPLYWKTSSLIAEWILGKVLCQGLKVMTISQAQALKDNLYVISLLKVIIELRDLQLDTEPEHVAF